VLQETKEFLSRNGWDVRSFSAVSDRVVFFRVFLLELVLAVVWLATAGCVLNHIKPFGTCFVVV